MARPPITSATRALDALGIVWTGHTYVHDPRERDFGLEAARELGVVPERVFKTLVVAVETIGLAVAVIPVAALLDLREFAQQVGGKHADLAQVGAAERATGYVHGGISPVGQRRHLPTVIDLSAFWWPTIFVSGGRRGFDLEVQPVDLVRAAQAKLHSITRATAS